MIMSANSPSTVVYTTIDDSLGNIRRPAVWHISDSVPDGISPADAVFRYVSLLHPYSDFFLSVHKPDYIVWSGGYAGSGGKDIVLPVGSQLVLFSGRGKTWNVNGQYLPRDVVMLLGNLLMRDNPDRNVVVAFDRSVVDYYYLAGTTDNILFVSLSEYLDRLAAKNKNAGVD